MARIVPFCEKSLELKKVCLLSALIVLGHLTVIAQNSDFASRAKILLNTNTIDSVQLEMHTYTDVFNRIDSVEWFYIYTDTITDSSGIRWIGSRILDGRMTYDKRKVGIWKAYYPNDTLKAIGTYALGVQTWCQASGPSESSYSYKSGEWQYFYDNGSLQARGSFQREMLKFNNNCGGDGTFYGSITDTWFFYDDKGNVITPDQELIDSIERVFR